jgi:hypothetical protein
MIVLNSSVASKSELNVPASEAECPASGMIISLLWGIA